MPQRLHIDYETFSRVDINDVGAYRYAFDPSTEILCAALALGDEEPVVWNAYTSEDFSPRVYYRPPDFNFDRYWDALEDPETLVYAFNAQFEIAISQALMLKTWGIHPPDISRWRCAQSIARRAALPGSLDKLGEVLNLATQKDKRGKVLMKKFSMMQKADAGTKGSKRTPGRPAKPVHRIYPKDDPAAFAEFLEYCKTDVIVERAATKKLDYFDEPINNANYTLHEKINARGVAVNLGALRQAQRLIDEESALVGERFRALTGFEFTQNKELMKWLKQNQFELPNLQAETIETALEEWDETRVCPDCGDSGVNVYCDDPPLAYKCICQYQKEAVHGLRLKQSVAFVSIKKVATMLECAGPHDNRIRGMLNHHGATTGRSTNSLVQFQNMKRPAGHMAAPVDKGSKLTWSEVAYQAICDGISREELELQFGPVLEVISSCIRHFVQDV